MYSLLADLVVLFHLAFVVFVVVGAALALRWPRVAWLHVPSAVWGVLVELAGLPCPLTPLENWLRMRAGGTGYAGGFVEHYLLPLLYPGALTREIQVVIGALVFFLNVALYGWVILRRRRRTKS